jgi:hypothetical protein
MPSLSILAAESPRNVAAAFLAAALAPVLIRVAPHRLQLGLPVDLSVLLHRFSTMLAVVDPAVVVLFVPLCALMLALLYETARVALRQGALPDGPPPRTRPLLLMPDDIA